MSDINTTILDHVNAPNYRPVKPKVIAKKLGFEGKDFSRLKMAIKKLVKAGKLAYGPNHLVCGVAKDIAKDIEKDIEKEEKPGGRGPGPRKRSPQPSEPRA